MKYSTAAGIFRLKAYWKEEKEIEEKAMELLKLFDMQNSAYTTAKTFLMANKEN